MTVRSVTEDQADCDWFAGGVAKSKAFLLVQLVSASPAKGIEDIIAQLDST